MPSSEATYVVLLSRACPSFSYDDILHHIPLAVGHELIHAARIREGEHMIWPDSRLSVAGRWWERVRAKFGFGRHH